MNIAGLVFLIITQFLTGRGVLALFNIRHKPVETIVVSNICGVMIFSVIPLVLQMMFVPITTTSVAVSILIVTALSFFSQWKKYDFTLLRSLQFKRPPVYELFFIALFIGLMIPSVWRCFYYPPHARDVLSGAEALAEYTVREHTMLNSVFTVNLESTNNHLKPPFILDLQIIYKLFVYEFGELWLSVMVVSFLIWIYSLLKEKLHPVVAGLLLLVFISMPDPYGYTYVVLYDYCNAIMMFAGYVYLTRYAETRRWNFFFFAVLMFGFATFIRSETIFFVAMACPLLLYLFRINKVGYGKQLGMIGTFLLVPVVFYYIWMGVFVKYYMPLEFDPGQQIVLSADRIDVFFQRLEGINTRVLFGGRSVGYYGYLSYVVVLVILADIIFVRSFNRAARIAFYAAVVIYFGLPLLGALVPWVDFNNTTKRGLFKLFPLLMLYLCNSPVLMRLSAAIRAFEMSTPEPEPAPVPKPVVSQKKKKR